MVKVAVFGATGELGRVATLKCFLAGHQVYGVVNSTSKAELLLPTAPRLKLIEGDYNNAAQVTKILQENDASVVISCVGRDTASTVKGLYSQQLKAFVSACDAAGCVTRLIIVTADFDASIRSPETPAPWFYRTWFHTDLHADMRKLEDWLSALCGIEFGRPRAADSPQVLQAHRLTSAMTVTVVRPYTLTAWETEEVRVQATSAETKGLAGCSYSTSRLALGKWLGQHALDPVHANKAILIDTPRAKGCM